VQSWLWVNRVADGGLHGLSLLLLRRRRLQQSSSQRAPYLQVCVYLVHKHSLGPSSFVPLTFLLRKSYLRATELHYPEFPTFFFAAVTFSPLLQQLPN
jgi:hypothetical protein